MMAVDFSPNHEWWVQNRVFRRIIAAIPEATERHRELKIRLSQSATIGHLDFANLARDDRVELRDMLVDGVSRVIEALEQSPRDGNPSETIAFYRQLRATALASVEA